MKTLKVGDTVLWSGGFGRHAAQPAKVVSIERCPPGEKYGDDVQSIHWCEVKEHAIVDLDNGHWAYGAQLRPVEEARP